MLVGLTTAGLLLSPATAMGTPPDPGDAPPPDAHPPYSLLQMNICDSGLAGCFTRTQYPKILDEVVEHIQSNDVNAVTLNEACSGDVAEIAKRTGYQFRFATVIYKGAPLACTTPGGRGEFGNAVLTKEAIKASEDEPYSVFSGVEQRRWLCVTTARGLDVCTSHLSTDGEAPGSANSTQCAELNKVLASRGRPTIFAGDVNRHGSCAPQGDWTLTDAAATQDAGIQHAYGNLSSPSSEVEPTTHTDHDALVVRAGLPK
jgi:endonuclease/exonuclease/phosphatase family metal-dependent hydrolase